MQSPNTLKVLIITVWQDGRKGGEKEAGNKNMIWGKGIAAGINIEKEMSMGNNKNSFSNIYTWLN